MGKHHSGRLAAIVVSVLGFAISLVFNGLSVVGVGTLNIFALTSPSLILLECLDFGLISRS